MIFHANRLPANDHIMPYLLFLKKPQNFNCRLLQIKGGALRVNTCKVPPKMLELLAYQPCDQTALDLANFMHGKICMTLMLIGTSMLDDI